MKLIKQLIVFSISCALLLYLEAGIAALADPTKPADYQAKASDGPAVAGAPAQATIELRAIIISNDKRIAIINGQLVRVGEKISDKQVVKIEQDRVELLGPTGASTILTISGQPIKQPK